MEITRAGIACPLCPTITEELVYLVLSAQSPFPLREVIRDRWRPAGCHLLQLDHWRKEMPPLPRDNDA
ncbi:MULTISPECIES: hypothetical protein [unclassified Streptomyces]|uniref:hypothetical protein n=1 Tax=unclassified Streptomyces TaxID=2593676 RepID=UPI002E2EA51D|nr:MULTISPECIES: hypothetical protein [unclassified Streptomyces]